ncbi:MAG: cupin domain-containing protein [Verrucomicrobiae bacterium]|nr:cupin domain-containing protein [Verrucomicrobiae bacterium]
MVNVADLPLDHSSKGSRFACATGEIGQTLGLDVLGAMLHVVPAGKTAFPMHRHHVSDEMFFVLEGAGEYRTDKGTFPMVPGANPGAPAGGIAQVKTSPSTGSR